MLGRALAALRSAAGRGVNRVRHFGTRHRCASCGARLGAFRRDERRLARLREHGYLFVDAEAETEHPAAGRCPVCNCPPRIRLYRLYLDRLIAGLDPPHHQTMVDFGPNAELESHLRRQPRLRYRTADLHRDRVDDRDVDLTDMRGVYGDDSVDLFICSHVLEHIEDDEAALRELHRITRPGGRGIVMAPIVLSLTEDYENPAATTEAERWKHFGQWNHVRVYSRSGFITKIERAGFTVHQLGAAYFGEEALRRNGLDPNTTLYVAEKRGGG